MDDTKIEFSYRLSLKNFIRFSYIHMLQSINAKIMITLSVASLLGIIISFLAGYNLWTENKAVLILLLTLPLLMILMPLFIMPPGYLR